MAAGHQVKIFEDPTLEEWQRYAEKVALVITSTTGQGDLPDCIVSLYNGIKEKLGYQPTLRYGIIALGDSSYDAFCGGGKSLQSCCRISKRFASERCCWLMPRRTRSRKR